MTNRSPMVDAFLNDLEHPFKDEVLKLREIILDADDAISERIKWNAPSFCYAGDDRVTFRLFPPKAAQLIFHRGAKKRNDTFAFDDPAGLLTWVASDRATVTFTSMDDVLANQDALARLVRAWMIATSA